MINFSLSLSPLRLLLQEEEKGDFWNRTVVSTVRAAESWDSSPPPAATAAGGWGIPDSGLYIR